MKAQDTQINPTTSTHNKLVNAITDIPIVLVGGIIFTVAIVVSLARELLSGGHNIRKVIQQANL